LTLNIKLLLDVKEIPPMNSLKFWAVFTIGVAAGAAVALIYAPQTGVKTRRQLKRGFDDASDYVKDATAKVSDQAQDVYSRGKSVVSSAVESATSVASAATDAAKKKISEYA
jgi:gas vesicle protein